MSYLPLIIAAVGVGLIIAAPARSRRAWITLTLLLAALGAVTVIDWYLHRPTGSDVTYLATAAMIGGLTVFIGKKARDSRS
ncbi:hypothetical protein ACX9NE_20070 [Mycobacterium sp. ML4]